MRKLTTIAAVFVALATPAAARSRLVALDRSTLACSDEQALETALMLARLHDAGVQGSRRGAFIRYLLCLERFMVQAKRAIEEAPLISRVSSE